MLLGGLLTLVGFVGLLCSLYFKIGNEAVLASAGLMSTGTGFFSKERFQQSPQAAKLYSRRPPGFFDATGIVFGVGLELLRADAHRGAHIAGQRPLAYRLAWVKGAVWFVVLLFLLGITGCAGSERAFDPLAARTHANALRDELNGVSVQVAQAGGYIPAVCAWRGERSPECETLGATYRGLQQVEQTARAAIDLYDQTGVAASRVSEAVGAVLDRAEAFAADVKRTAEVVHEEIRRVAGLDRGSPVQPPSPPERGAPAEGEGPPNPGPTQVMPLAWPVS
jgi:hypothetical protein